MSAVPRPNRRRDFELAIICALPLEADAVIALFDHHHSEDGEEGYGKAADDQNAYTTGVIGNHNIVVAHMPGMGKVSAAGVAVGLRMSFPNIKLALVVGICGGVPGGLNGREIYLGDVVISQCLVQYDFGKQYPMAFEPKDSIQGGSGVPPIAVQALLRKLETHYHSAGLQEDTNMFLRELQENSRRALYPGAEFDQLFKPLYLHQHRSLTDCATCGEDGSHACANAIVTACQELGCGAEGLVHRERNSDNHEQVFWPSIHFGRMGSGDTVMKSGSHRDDTARRDGIIAFEMEGAGVYAHFPSLVIKGVCDYADSHKNKQWQDYAAAAAAACTKAFLKRWASERVHHDLVAKPAVKPIFMVDILRDNSLIGREDVMQFLENKLSPERHNRVALVALGGIGKTRIALEYALRLKDSSVSVFWIHASTKARILDCYAKIAKKANLVGYDVKAADSGDPQPVKEWLEGDSCGRWLIILDNADDHDLLYGSSRLIDIFPRSENGSILMTTRDKKVGFDFAGASRLFPLQRLGSDQAQELLLSNFDDEADIDPPSCKELCDELEGIPLAIVQASAFMHQNSITAEEYLEYYRESSDAQISLLSQDFEDSVRDKDSKNPVAATWVISFEYIEKKVPLAGELLKRMSILDSHAIPTSLIQTEDPRHNQIKALGTLQAFCLITARQSATKRAKETDKRYDLHRLVRLAARNWLKQRGLLLQQTAEILRIVAGKYPDVESTGIKEMDRCTAYLPHAIAVLSSGEIQGTGEGGLGEVAPAFRGQQMMAEHSRHEVPCAVCAGDLMMNVSRTFELTPPREGSIKWVMVAVALRTFVFGQSHQRTIEALILAAMIFYDVNQIEQARMFGEKAVLLIETATDPPAPLVAWKFEIMGFVQMVYGGLPNEYFRKAIEARVAAFGPDHAEVTRTKLHLSSTYLNQGRFAEYEELMKDIIDSDTRTHGPASVRALAAKWSLAKNYALNGRRREALLLRTQIAASESGVGEGKNLQNDLFLFHSCLSQSDVGNHDEAVKLAEQILELGSETCIPRLTSMKLLATCYEQQGRYAEAEELRIKVMRQATKVEREESPEAIESMGDLADLYGRRGKYKEATLLRERIIKIEIKRLDKQNPKILLDMCELGLNYSFLGQLDKAAKYRYSSLNYPLETPEARLPSHIDRMATIARELNLHDEYIEAEKLGWAAVGLLRMHEKATQYRAARSVTWLADTYARLNNIEQAEELYREALDILSFGDGISYEALSVRTKLASLLLREARYTEAEALAAETRGNLSGLEYPNQQSIISNLRTLAAVYAEQGRFSLAELRCSDLLARLQSNTPKPEDLAPSSVLNAVNDLETVALTYEGARRYEKAGNIYRKTIAIRNQLKGSSNLRTLKATTRYIDTMNSQAHYSEALALGLECKERYQQREKQATAFEEMILASIDKGLAVSFAGLANYTNAEPLAREALETYCRNVGCDHPQYLDCLVVLTWILREKNDTNLSEVKEMGVQVLEGWTKVVGEKHLRTAEAMEALALTCGKIGDQEEAECLKRIAGEIREGLDLGLEGEEKKKLDDLVQQLLADFGADNDEFALAIGRLRVG